MYKVQLDFRNAQRFMDVSYSRSPLPLPLTNKGVELGGGGELHVNRSRLGLHTGHVEPEAQRRSI